MEGLIYGGKFAFQNDRVSLIVRSKFTELLCFTLYLRAIFQRRFIFGILRYLLTSVNVPSFFFHE